MNKQLLHTFLWVGAGVALYMTLANTVGGIVNPLLANVKLSATLS